MTAPQRKSGRPAGRVTDKNINIRISSAELETAHEGAELLGFSFSEFVREAIRRMLCSVK